MLQNLRYRPRGDAAYHPQSKAPIGASAGEVKGGTVDWGFLATRPDAFGSSGYDLLGECTILMLHLVRLRDIIVLADCEPLHSSSVFFVTACDFRSVHSSQAAAGIPLPPGTLRV